MLRPILIGFILSILLFTGCEESPTAAIESNAVYTTFGGDYDDVGSAVVQTPDGGYLIVGTSYSGAGTTLSDMYVLKTNSNGTATSDSVFTSMTDAAEAIVDVSSFDLISDVKVLDDGGYILVGSKYVTATNYDVWLIKLASDLSVTFSNTFAGPGNDFGFSVNLCDDNGFIIAGKTFNTASGYDMWVIKTGSDGNKVAGDNTADGGFGDVGTAGLYVYSTPTMNDAAYNAIQISSGEYIVTGKSRTAENNDDMMVLKLSSKGVLVTSFGTAGVAIFGGGLDESSKFIQETSDGGFIIVGNSFSNGSGQSDIYVVKTSDVGAKVWDTYIGNTRNDFANCVKQTSDGGFVIAGNSYTSSSDIMVVKISPNTQGEVEWNYTMDGSFDDVGNYINQTSDGGYIITGSTYSNTKMNEVILIKLDASGTKEF